MKRLTLVLTCFFISMGLAIAQTTNVSGTVVDETGEPIIGASVQAKGTTIGNVTDIDGKFTLSVPASVKTLVISYIGMATQEVAVQPTVRVMLRTSTVMVDEVVVTAMGITKATKALGYAHQEIKSDALLQGANSSLSGALQGKTSGLEIKPSSGMPGASSQIVIRGARSFTGNNSPLYVIDGMPVASTPDIDTGGSVSGTDFGTRGVDVDPNDIESINILKGQAAAALYGIRASNGVIVITTKSGKGLSKGKPQVSFASNVSADVISRVPEVQTIYAQGAKGAYSPNASTSWGPKIVDLPKDDSYGGDGKNMPDKDIADSIMYHNGRMPDWIHGLPRRYMTTSGTSLIPVLPSTMH